MNLLPKTGRWYESFYARDYLMFKSSVASSRWVALGQTQWPWYATVSRTGLLQPWTVGATRSISDPTFTGSRVPPRFTAAFDTEQSMC